MDWRKPKIIFAAIIVIAFFLRFWSIGENPPSLTWDEAAWGYNAYSLGIDGRDEFGRYLPLNYLESFGDFKPVVYAYLTILPVKIFGLSEFATRFPSALFGFLTVFLTYFLVKKIFWESKLKEYLALTSAFLLAISPWHILLSRAAFEANVASFFIVAGVFFFIKGIQDKNWTIIISVLFFVASIYTFNTARVVTPLLFVFLTFVFRKKLIENKKKTAIAFLTGIILVLPILSFLFTPQASLRFKEVNIFSDPGVVQVANQQIENDNNAFWSRVLHNRRLGYFVSYLRHYFDNLSPQFLFVKGDGNPKFSIQDVGQLYLWEAPFFVLGILVLFRFRQGFWWIIPMWLVIGIVPAAAARETPHALRIEAALPTFQIISAIGIVFFLSKISSIKYKISNIQIKYLIFSLFFLILFVNFFYFVRNYSVHYPYTYSGEWQYGYKESIDYVKSVEEKYDNIYITNELGRPYIYYLFYLKVDPEKFRRESKIKRDVFGFVSVESFGKYKFYDELKKQTENKNLFIKTPKEVPSDANIKKAFTLLNDNQVLVAYE
jgi:4-amino-4-deoxy-L-arabinose transferase-like glycosyltransferase